LSSQGDGIYKKKTERLSPKKHVAKKTKRLFLLSSSEASKAFPMMMLLIRLKLLKGSLHCVNDSCAPELVDLAMRREIGFLTYTYGITPLT